LRSCTGHVPAEGDKTMKKPDVDRIKTVGFAAVAVTAAVKPRRPVQMKVSRR
jgi:hypothetical protein